MWSRNVLLLLLSIAVGVSASNTAWKPGAVYKYRAEARTLTALHQVDDTYYGTLIKAVLELRPKNNNIILAQLSQPKYASIQAKLPGGWNSPIPEQYLNMRSLPLSREPFEIVLQDGLVAGLVVSSNVPTWEVNMLKALAGQLQVNTEGKELVSGGPNARPNHAAASPNAVFRAMEDSVTGKCEVLYDIAPLPSYIALVQPHLVPLVKNIADTPLIEVVKTRNYSNCDRRIAFNFGFPGGSEFQHPDGNQAGEFLSRSSVSRLILSGNLDRYTIQSSIATSKVIVSPLLYNQQKSMVVSSWNLTLASIKSASGSPQAVPSPKKVNGLSYTYENVYRYKPSHGQSQSDASSSSSSESSASSSGSSSEESRFGRTGIRGSTEQQRSSASRQSSEENKSISGSIGSIWRRNSASSEEKSQESVSASKDPSGWYSNSQEQDTPYYGGMKFKRAINYRDSASQDSRSQSYEQNWDESRQSAQSSGEPWSGESSGENATAGMDWSRESSNESSEESSYLPLALITEPLGLPMLPFFAGTSGKSLDQKINVVDFVRKLAYEIAIDARSINVVVKQNALAKISILKDVIRTMSTKQLQSVTSSLYTSQSSSSSESQNSRRLAWIVFRDSVALSGTPPALMVLKDWIMNSRIEGQEAALLIGVLPTSAMMPTAQYLHELYKLVFSPKVEQQQHLNVSALLAFTKLIRMSQIDNSTVHKYYPVHIYGRPAARSDTTWQKVYLPQLKRRLEDAVAKNDSVKIQVYIRAIGTIGHPLVVKVFEPYLERQINITTYQRTWMVISMGHVSKLYPEVGRQVLFKIYQNTAESHELRCAAVLLLFSTNPPRAMLQRMAEFTNYDTHAQVNSAVKSGLLSLASLKGSAYRGIASAAKSAVNMLNTTKISDLYSRSYVHSYESDKYSLSYAQVINYIGSDDTIIPKSLYFNVTRNIGGYKHKPISFGAMTSSIPDLLALLRAQFRSGKLEFDSGSVFDESSEESTPLDWESKFTPQHITKLLGLKSRNLSEPLEGNLMFRFGGLSQFFAFDNTTIKKIPQVFQQLMAALGSERNFNFTKFFNQYEATLAFPVATGLPFVYSLKTPTVISVGGKARLRPQWDEQKNALKAVNATGQLDIWYSSKLQAQIGFITPFDNQHYISGVSQDIQVNLPVRAKVDVDWISPSFKLIGEPINQEEKTTILYYKSAQFVAHQNILNPKPLSEEPSYKLVVNNDFSQMDKSYGEQSIGMPFHVHYNTSGNIYSILERLEEVRKDPLMLIYFPLASEGLQCTTAKVDVDMSRSSTRSVIVNIAYVSKNITSAAQERGQWSSSEEESGSWQHPRHKKSKSSSYPLPSYSSQRRIVELIERASSGIKNSSVKAIDLSVEFPGQRNAEFWAAAAWARSPVDEYSRVVASAYQKPASDIARPQQVCFDMTNKIPYVPLLNFKEALRASPIISSDASLNIGEKCHEGSHITARAKFSQSKERKAYVSKHPMAQLCERQMSEGNYALPACRNVTAEANYMDQLDVQVKYNVLPNTLRNITYKSYSALLAWWYPYVEEDVFVERPIQNEIKLKWKLSPNLKEWNVSLESPIVNAKLEHWPLGPVASQILGVHPVYWASDRLSRVLLADQLDAKCTIGNNAVNTFDNSTYSVYMGKCWHVMLKLAPKPTLEPELMYLSQYSDVAVLVRDAGSLKKEVKFITGEDVIDLTPVSSHQDENRGYADGKVRVNGVSLKISSNNVTYIYNNHGVAWVEIFNLPSGEISLRWPIHGLWALYDGQTIQLSANDSYRNDVVGLCGTFDGEPITDMVSPMRVLLNDSQLFSASYSLSEDCQGPVASIRRKAIQQGAVLPGAENIPVNLIDDNDLWGDLSSDSSSSSSQHSDEDLSSDIHDPSRGAMIPTVFRTKIFTDDAHTCFSVHPLPTCASGSHASSRIQKNIPVYCISSSNPTARKLKAMVDSGANPDLRRKGASKYLKVSLPKACARG